jgi:hypothetical protein
MKPISSYTSFWLAYPYFNLFKNFYYLFEAIKTRCNLRLYLCLAVLFSTTNCTYNLKTQDFNSSNTSAVFKLNINYDGYKTSAENTNPFTVLCRAHIENLGFFVGYRFMNNDYIFVPANDKKNFVFRGVYCGQTYGLYGKYRNYVLKEAININLESGKVNYVGDFNITWKPKAFYWADMVLNAPYHPQSTPNTKFVDDGDFSLIIENNENKLKNYAKYIYKVDEIQIINKVPKELVGKIFK